MSLSRWCRPIVTSRGRAFCHPPPLIDPFAVPLPTEAPFFSPCMEVLVPGTRCTGCSLGGSHLPCGAQPSTPRSTQFGAHWGAFAGNPFGTHWGAFTYRGVTGTYRGALACRGVTGTYRGATFC
jgi:hypothetical protein